VHVARRKVIYRVEARDSLSALPLYSGRQDAINPKGTLPSHEPRFRRLVRTIAGHRY
jgi:hypothetical protein